MYFSFFLLDNYRTSAQHTICDVEHTDINTHIGRDGQGHFQRSLRAQKLDSQLLKSYLSDKQIKYTQKHVHNQSALACTQQRHVLSAFSNSIQPSYTVIGSRKKVQFVGLSVTTTYSYLFTLYAYIYKQNICIHIVLFSCSSQLNNCWEIH